MQDFWTSNSRVLILICFWNVKTFPSSSSSSSHVEHPPQVAKLSKIFLRSKKVLRSFFQIMQLPLKNLFLNGQFLMWASPAVCKSGRFSRFFSPRLTCRWLARWAVRPRARTAPGSRRGATALGSSDSRRSSRWSFFSRENYPPGI